MRKDRLKKWGGLLLSLCLLAGFAPSAAAAAEVWDGSTITEPKADENGVYQISTGAELAWFAQQVNAGQSAINAVLTQDIDLGNHPWTPIGIGSPTTTRFKGGFDGKGHRVQGLKVEMENTYYAGLFGYIETKGSVENLSVEGSSAYTGGSSSGKAGGVVGYNKGHVANCTSGVTVQGLNCAGGVAGYNDGGTVANCTNEGDVQGKITVDYGTDYGIGGIVGASRSAAVENCINKGEISNQVGKTMYGGIGGVVGLSSQTTVKECCNVGTVDGAGSKQVGGVVGYLYSGTVQSVYNTGAVTGSKVVGGVVGERRNGDDYVQNAYSAGTVTAQSNGGGVAGIGTTAKFTNCYFLKTDTVNAGLEAVGGESAETVCGKTEAEMKGAEVLAALNNGLDSAAFVADDGDVNGGFPIFFWQAVPREPEPPALLIDGNPAESGCVLTPGTHTVSVTWRNRRAGTLLLLGVYREEALLTCALAPAGEDAVSLTQELAAGTVVRAFFWDSALAPQESTIEVFCTAAS